MRVTPESTYGDGVDGSSRPGRAHPGRALLLALLVSTLAVRPQLTSVGPLLPKIQGDLGIGHAMAGLLVTIPVLCMGLFALPAARVLRRIDVRTAISWCLAAISAATFLRAVSPGLVLVLLLTFPFGIAAGVMGALLPAVVKERFSEHPALGTGVFAFGLNLGAALGAGLAVPLADATGGWRWSLGISAGAGALALPAWIRFSRRSLGSALPVTTVEHLPWRNPLAWGATLVFGFQGICFFGLNAWLADAMVERGWSDGRAGALVALLNILAVPGVLLVSILAGRIVSVRLYLGMAAVGLLAGTLGLAQGGVSAWVWAGLISLSLGSLFALSMTLTVIVADRPGEAAAVAGMQLGVGYTLAALAPFVLGALRDVSGGFGAGLWVIAAVAAVVVAAVAGTVVLLEGHRRHPSH
jgi:MFS transporter, CP family, cyanate transporter